MTEYIIIPFVFLIMAFLIKMPIGWGMFIGCIAYFMAKGIDLSVVINTAGYGIYSNSELTQDINYDIEGKLVLENGMIFEGESIGADGTSYGEIVFNKCNYISFQMDI